MKEAIIIKPEGVNFFFKKYGISTQNDSGLCGFSISGLHNIYIKRDGDIKEGDVVRFQISKEEFHSKGENEEYVEFTAKRYDFLTLVLEKSDYKKEMIK